MSHSLLSPSSSSSFTSQACTRNFAEPPAALHRVAGEVAGSIVIPGRVSKGHPGLRGAAAVGIAYRVDAVPGTGVRVGVLNAVAGTVLKAPQRPGQHPVRQRSGRARIGQRVLAAVCAGAAVDGHRAVLAHHLEVIRVPGAATLGGHREELVNLGLVFAVRCPVGTAGHHQALPVQAEAVAVREGQRLRRSVLCQGLAAAGDG